MDLDLAQVRAFVAVVDHGHFGRAAESLSLSQQALSKRVARLEAGLGPLLERRRSGVGLTAAGERLLPNARQLLEVADIAIATARDTPPSPLRVDVWGELQLPAALMRAIARADRGLVVELSMRRDLAAAVAALQRHELDLAFGNAAALDTPLPQGLSSELIGTDTISALVSARGPLAAREHLTPDDLARHGIWWPLAGSSGELQAFVTGYARSISAPIISVGTNLGLDAYVDYVAADSSAVTMVVATWPLSNHHGVRVVPLHPAPQYPWHAIWRTASPHPSLARVLRSLRARAQTGHDAGPSGWADAVDTGQARRTRQKVPKTRVSSSRLTWRAEEDFMRASIMSRPRREPTAEDILAKVARRERRRLFPVRVQL